MTTFYSIARLQEIPAGDLLRLTATGFTVLHATYLLALLVARLCGLKDRFRKTFLLGATYGNQVFLGVPVCYSFLGQQGTVPAFFLPSADISSFTGRGRTS